jgi:hypothetical protein
VVGIELPVSRNAEWFELLEQVDTEGNITAAGMRIYANDPLEVADIEVRYRVTYQIPDGSSVRFGQSEANVFLTSDLVQQVNEWVLNGVELSEQLLRIVSDYYLEGTAGAMGTVASMLVEEIYQQAYFEPAQKAIKSRLSEELAKVLWEYLQTWHLLENRGQGANPLGFRYVFSRDEYSKQELQALGLAVKEVWGMLKDEEVAKLEDRLKQRIAQAPALQGKRVELKNLDTAYEVRIQRLRGNCNGPLGIGIGLELGVRPIVRAEVQVGNQTVVLVQGGVYVLRQYPDAHKDSPTGIGNEWHVNHKAKELDAWHRITRHLLGHER